MRKYFFVFLFLVACAAPGSDDAFIDGAAMCQPFLKNWSAVAMNLQRQPVTVCSTWMPQARVALENFVTCWDTVPQASDRNLRLSHEAILRASKFSEASVEYTESFCSGGGANNLELASDYARMATDAFAEATAYLKAYLD